MFWATRLLKIGGDTYVRELFETQRAFLNSPRNMMLIAVSNEVEQRRLFVGVPEVWLLDAYYGFEPCSKKSIPLVPDLISGHQDLFQALFT